MILEFPLSLARFSGLLINYETSSKWIYLIIFLTLLNLANFVFGIGYFTLEHLDSLDYFTNSFGAFSNMLVNLLKTCMFLARNRKFRQMMNRLEGFALDQKRSNFPLSLMAERKTECNTKKYLMVVYISVLGITMSPLLAMVSEYLSTGQVVDKRYELPFKTAYFFFDVTTSPFYEIVYLVSAIGIPATTHCIAAIDTIFMGLCLHTVALFKDLKGSLIKVDQEMSEETEFKSAMNPLIDYHNQILAVMEEIQSAFSGIFFTQFVGTIFILCSQSYLGFMNRGNIEFISNITFYCASATQAFIYTNYGGLLAAESSSVSVLVAGLNWHEKHPKLRIYYRMMIHRAQRCRGLSFLHWIHSNRKLMLNLIIISYNVFAVLKNLKAKN